MKKLLVFALFLNALLLAGRLWQELPAVAEKTNESRTTGMREMCTEERFCV